MAVGLGVVIVVRVVVAVVAVVDAVGIDVLDATVVVMFTMVVVGIKKYIT